MGIITELIVRMALENPLGLHPHSGCLYNLGQEVGGCTIENILEREGIQPAPDRGPRCPLTTGLPGGTHQLERRPRK